jgi:hypothetical protein
VQIRNHRILQFTRLTCHGIEFLVPLKLADALGNSPETPSGSATLKERDHLGLSSMSLHFDSLPEAIPTLTDLLESHSSLSQTNNSTTPEELHKSRLQQSTIS